MNTRILHGEIRAPAASAMAAPFMLATLLLSVGPMFLLLYPPKVHKVTLDAPAPWAEVAVYFHPLELMPTGEARLDGEILDLIGLTQRLNLIAVTPGHGVDLRADPNARYEHFAEVLTLIRRARIDRLRVDNRRFAHAIDARAR